MKSFLDVNINRVAYIYICLHRQRWHSAVYHNVCWRWNPQHFQNLVQDKNPTDGFNLYSTSILHVSQYKQGFTTDEGEGKKDCSVSNTH